VEGTAVIEERGERVLNMIHRDDVIGACIAALRQGVPGETYNVVDDAPVTQREFFTWLAQATNRPLPPASPSGSTAGRRRGLTHKRVSNRKLKEALNYAFKYPTFREGYAEEVLKLKRSEG
jgi:nucleoside-diphosphate-sugar epimerase